MRQTSIIYHLPLQMNVDSRENDWRTDNYHVNVETKIQEFENNPKKRSIGSIHFYNQDSKSL